MFSKYHKKIITTSKKIFLYFLVINLLSFNIQYFFFSDYNKASAAISAVNGASNFVNDTNMSISISPSAGNTLILHIQTGGATISSIGTTGASTSWSLATSRTSGNSDSYMYYVTDIPSGITAVNITISSFSNFAASVGEFSGIMVASPLDGVNNNSANFNTSASTGDVTTSSADTIIVAGAGWKDWATISSGPTNSFNTLTSTSGGSSGNNFATLAYRIVSSTGTYSTGWTISTNADWATTIAAFKSADSSQIEQNAFRWRSDDGSESSATWLASQGVNISRDIGLNTRLRVQATTTGDAPSSQYQLEYKLSTDNWWTKATTTDNEFTTPIYIGAGTFTSGTGALSVPNPSGIQDGDVLIMCANSANQDITTPTGWTEVSGSPQGTGTAAAVTAVRLEAFYKVVNGTQSNVSVSDAGSYTAARIFAFRGVSTTTPIDASAGSVETASTTSMSWPDITTTVPNTAIIQCAGLDDDESDTTNVSSQTNASLTGITEVSDNTVTSGVGGGLSAHVATKASAGAIGNTTATGDLSNRHAYMSIALKPIIQKILIKATTNITDTGEDTTAQLSVPNSKSFTAGRINDTENPGDAVDIATDRYSEFEWNLVATSTASYGEVYQFRITKAGTVFNSYTAIPEWTIEAPIISGTVYSSETGSNIGAGVNVGIYKNGSTLVGTDTTDSNGAYSIMGSISSSDILTVYIDDNATNGAVILISDGTSKSNVNIFGNNLIIRSDTGSNITNADLSTGYISSDSSDMVHSVSANNLTLSSNINLMIYTGNTYIPGGTITTQGNGDIRVATSSIMFFDTDNNVIAGDLLAYDSSLVYLNKNTTVNGGEIGTRGTSNSGNFLYSGGSFTPNITLSGTGTIRDGNATSTFYSLILSDSANISVSTDLVLDNGISIDSSSQLSHSAGIMTVKAGSISNSGSLTFNDLIIAGSVSTNSTFSVTGDLSISSGTLSGTGSITVNGGDVTGSGIINMSGGTFLLDGPGLFGSNSNWTFNNLTFGDGSGSATTYVYGSGSITAATTTIANNQSLDAGISKIWNLTSSHEPFQVLGVFVASSSSIVYKSSGNATVTPVTYYNLEISPTSGNPVLKLATTSGQTIVINNNFTINGAGGAIVDAQTYKPNIDVNGSMTIGNGDVFEASNSSNLYLANNFSNNGTFSHNNGQVVLDTGNTSILSSSASMSFYNVSVTVPNKILKFQKHTNNTPTFVFNGQFTVTGSLGNPIMIESDTPGNQWSVDFNVSQSNITYASIKDSGCLSGSFSIASNGTNSSGGNNGSCWNIFNMGADGSGTVTSVEQGSGGGILQIGGSTGSGGDPSEENGGGGTHQGGGGYGGGFHTP